MLKIKLNYNAAVMACERFEYNLIRIEDDYTNNFIYRLTKSLDVDKFWIDGNDIKEEGKFANSDGINLNYTKFAKKEPNNYQNEDCLVGNYHRDAEWNDIDCNHKYAVICYKNHTFPSNKSTIISPKGTFIFSYELMTFSKARSFCEDEGLNLLEIKDLKTNSMILKLSIAYKVGKYWIENTGLQCQTVFTLSDYTKITFDTNRKTSLQGPPSECIYESNGLDVNSKGKPVNRKYDTKRLRWTQYDYESLYSTRSSYWDFANCGAKYSVICS